MPIVIDGITKIQQKFFLQYARVWCEKQRESFKTKRLKTDPHSLGIARVNEQVKHHKEFEYAYSCKMNDPMVIDNNKRIRVW